MPEKYGSVPSSEWNPQWIFEQENTTIRRVLTDVIGWKRILSAPAVELLDEWREYELYKCPSLGDDEDDDDNNLPCVMLKMTCPSTSHEYFLRVPPDIDDARSAATWINHNIDPERMRVNT